MPLRVRIRPDTKTIWIMGTVRPPGAVRGYRVRRAAGTDDAVRAAQLADEIEQSLIAAHLAAARRGDVQEGPPRQIYQGPTVASKIRRRNYAVRSPGLLSAGAKSESNLYVMRCAGALKIGISLDAAARHRNISNACPLPVELLATYPLRLDIAGWAEFLAHSTLAEYHRHGEWFDCSVEDAVGAIEAAIQVASLVPSDWLLAGNSPAAWPVREADILAA